MTVFKPSTLALCCALCTPLAARAETASPTPATPAPATDVVTAAPAPAPTPPAAPAPEKPAPAPAPKVTFDFGAWIILNGWADVGALNAADLPRTALPGRSEQALGGSVRQSRLRATIGVPNDGGLVGGAVLKAFVETDFAGGYASADDAAPLLRLRHGYVQATWKDLGNLSVLAGQTADIFHGSVAAASLAHLATPRFAGAGYLYRRAPQLRIQGDLGKDVALAYQVGAISAADKATSTQPGAAATGVGYRSFAPDAEARVAFLYRAAGPLKAELGVGGRYGEEKWILGTGATAYSHVVKSQGVAADLKVEAGFVTVVGGAFAGENLDVANSLAPGVLTAGTAPAFTSVKSVPTKGAWGQLQVRPLKPLLLLAGAGVETPRKKYLSTAVTSVYRNVELSAGVLVDLTSRWRVGLEGTRYVSYTVDGKIARSDQLELSSLLSL